MLDDIKDISSIKDEESKNSDDNESVYNPDKASQSFYAKKTGDNFYEEPVIAEVRPHVEEL